MTCVTTDERGVTSDLPRKIAKRIRGECQHCAEPALDGSDYCAGHGEHARENAATRQKRHRQKLADAGLCVGKCGRKVPKRRRPDGTIRPSRCAKCRKEHSARMRDARARACVTSADGGVTTHADRIAARTDAVVDVTDGYARTRYRGQARRGAPSMEERDRRDLADMQRILVRYEQALGEAYSTHVAELTRDQQREARAAAHSILSLAVRLGMESLVRYGEGCPVLEIDDSDDSDDT